MFRINDHQALVQTVDFFPPIVDDPYAFGQIAAANALSDIYAMGGKPLTALNIVGFPHDKMPIGILTEILRGGNDKIEEAGAVVVGGHSIKDKELKFGVAVTGMIETDKIITNAGAKPGDILFLTKPLGTGIITTGIKRDKTSPEAARAAIKSMTSLNAAGSELMVRFGAHAATDITGFGLLGHAHEMASASGVTIRINAACLPLLPQAVELAAAGMNPGGANDNREFIKPHALIEASVDRMLDPLLYDPQTSGGLFIAIAPDRVDEFEKALTAAGLPSKPVGRVETRSQSCLIVE